MLFLYWYLVHVFPSRAVQGGGIGTKVKTISAVNAFLDAGKRRGRSKETVSGDKDRRGFPQKWQSFKNSLPGSGAADGTQRADSAKVTGGKQQTGINHASPTQPTRRVLFFETPGGAPKADAEQKNEGGEWQRVRLLPGVAHNVPKERRDSEATPEDPASDDQQRRNDSEQCNGDSDGSRQNRGRPQTEMKEEESPPPPPSDENFAPTTGDGGPDDGDEKTTKQRKKNKPPKVRPRSRRENHHTNARPRTPGSIIYPEARPSEGGGIWLPPVRPGKD